MKQDGVALITALLIVALTATVAASMVSSQHLDIRRTSNVLDTGQAWLYAVGIENWALDSLAEDAKENDTDSLKDDWATLLPPFEVEGGEISGYVEDLQGRFNLNNLVNVEGKKDDTQVQLFENLLDALGISADLVDALVDWLDKDIELTYPGGAEDAEYLATDPPYRSANQLMVHPSELLLIQGITRDVYEQLAPYVTTLPKNGAIPTQVNVNTAPAPVVQALAGKLTRNQAEELLQSRDEEPYENEAAFTDAVTAMIGPAGNGGDDDEGADAGNLLAGTYGVASGYFVVHADAEIGNSRFQLDSLIERPLAVNAGEGGAQGEETDDGDNGDNPPPQNQAGANEGPDTIHVIMRGWGR